jgi:hypothetical protein
MLELFDHREFAHVVAQEDGQVFTYVSSYISHGTQLIILKVQHWREAGLFPFSVKR